MTRKVERMNHELVELKNAVPFHKNASNINASFPWRLQCGGHLYKQEVFVHVTFYQKQSREANIMETTAKIFHVNTS